jgi:hypothetical protein
MLENPNNFSQKSWFRKIRNHLTFLVVGQMPSSVRYFAPNALAFSIWF